MDQKVEYCNSREWTQSLVVEALMNIQSKVASLSAVTEQERTALLTSATSEVFSEHIESSDPRVQQLREYTDGTRSLALLETTNQPIVNIDAITTEVRIATPKTLQRKINVPTEKDLQDIINDSELPDTTGELDVEEIIQLLALENIIEAAGYCIQLDSSLLNSNQPEELLEFLYNGGIVHSKKFQEKIRHIKTGTL